MTIRPLTALAAVLLLAAPASAQPKAPPVTVDDRLTSLEARVGALEAALGRRGDSPAAPPVVAPATSYMARTATPGATTRAAVGHTHTCSQGHTWDHTMDGGSHRCPFCGEAQYVVSNRRTVTALAGPPPAKPFDVGYGVIYSSPENWPTRDTVPSGGCSGSGCSTAGGSSPSTRGGWHPGKLLGRR